MRRRTISWMMRVSVFVVTAATTIVQLVPAEAGVPVAKPVVHKPISELPAGLTQCLTPAQWKQVDVKRAKALADKLAHRPSVRLLTTREMQQLHGRGLTSLRNKYFGGTAPWHRSFRDVNLCTGSLFKSFTDIQVQGGKGAGLALQRTYNSDDSRIGPFGVGWTHAYDIRCEEENPNNTSTDATLNYSDRQDFFGGRQKYHRDADGLYTPPAYLYDEHDGTYLTSLLNGPLAPLDDTDIAQDGTIKHYQNPASGTQVLADYNATTQNQERFCDTIQDRYGNTTHLSYVDSDITYGGIPFHLLSTVTDPSGRQLTFHWTNVSSGSQPMLRITQVDGPQYSVTYNYTLASGLPDGNLVSVTLAPTVQRAIPTRA